MSLIIVAASAGGTYAITQFNDARIRSDWATPSEAVADLPDMPPMLVPPVKLPAGSMAPALNLPGIGSSDSLDLDDYRGAKPVVLVFGSFTCNKFQERIIDLERLYQRYKDRVAFAFVAIPEAGHAIPGYEFLLVDIEHMAPPNSIPFSFERKKRPFAQGEENQARPERLLRAIQKAKLSLPAFLDLPGRDATTAYLAFPARLVVVNAGGYIEKDFGIILNDRWNFDEVGELLDADLAQHDATHPRTTE